jgi:hypothetical protein
MMDKNPLRDDPPSLRAEAAGLSSLGPAAAITTLERDILTCIGIIGTTDADDLSNILGESPRAVQDALIKLDDAGHVLMRNGWYRLSEAYKAGKL